MSNTIPMFYACDVARFEGGMALLESGPEDTFQLIVIKHNKYGLTVLETGFSTKLDAIMYFQGWIAGRKSAK